MNKLIVPAVVMVAGAMGLTACTQPTHTPAAPITSALTPGSIPSAQPALPSGAPTPTTLPTTAPSTPAATTAPPVAAPTTYPEGPGALNPAVTQATIHQTICVAGYTATVRPPEDYTYEIKKSQLAARGIYRVSGYQLDHVIALELGGAPYDPANLYTVTAAVNQAKGLIEDQLRREVCDGDITLAQGRAGDHQAQITVEG